ncbi:jhy protein homolog [Festucalex cinctus]
MDNTVRATSPNQGTAALTDSLEIDTESVAQVSVCKQQLRMHFGDDIVPPGKMDDSFKEGNPDVADANSNPHEDDMVCDSIEVAAHSQRTTEPERYTHKSKLDVSDISSELCCDPNWNTNEMGDVISERLNFSVPEHHHFCRQTPSQSQEPFISGYRYIVDTSSMTPHVSSSDCNQPYHLHPQDDQVSSITTQCYHSNSLCHSSPKSHSSHSCSDCTTHGQSEDQPKNSCANVDKNIKRSLETTEHMEEMHVKCLKEYQTYYQKELQHITGGSFQISPTTEISQTPGKKKRHTEGVVERNKITLGRSTSDNGSYVNMHALQQKKARGVKKMHEAAHQEATTECPKESSDPDLSLTQQLKVTHIIEESKQGNMEPSMEKSPKLQSTTALKCYLTIKEGKEELCPNEDCNHQSLENDSTLPSSTSHNKGVYTKLPPIMPKQCFRQGVKTINPNHRNSSAEILAQMEDKTGTRTNYKTYSLKEYKELKLDVKLQGLGPDYTAAKKQAEKMTQQKLYSIAVRERNKNISKRPFLLAKEPVGKDRKVPRIKALEYAKTIAKPLVRLPQPKSSKKQQSGDSIGHAPCLDGSKVSQTATVDHLMKRHQEEKEALFRKGHVI